MIVTLLLILCGVAGAVAALLTVIGVAIYDLREIKKEHQFQQRPYARRYRTHPFVSVIVAACDNQDAMERCLDSLIKSTHRKMEIIIVDTLPKSKMASFVPRYAAANSQRPIRLFKSKYDTAQAITNAYRRHGKGGLVMVIDGTSVLDKYACSKAVRHFNSDDAIGTVVLNDLISPGLSTIGLLQKYGNFLTYLSKKSSSGLNVMYFNTFLQAVYRKDVFTSKSVFPPLGNKQHRTYYAHDAVIYQQPAKSLFELLKQRHIMGLARMRALSNHRRVFFTRDDSFTKFLAWFYLPFAVYAGLVAFFLPLLLGYFLYVAIWLRQPTLFVLCLAVLSFFLLFGLWGENRTSLMQKIIYSALIPITFGTFYLLSFVPMFISITGISRRFKAGIG